MGICLQANGLLQAPELLARNDFDANTQRKWRPILEYARSPPPPPLIPTALRRPLLVFTDGVPKLTTPSSTAHSVFFALIQRELLRGSSVKQKSLRRGNRHGSWQRAVP
jgi:hypothetical protein